jgi:hypothetical protein
LTFAFRKSGEPDGQPKLTHKILIDSINMKIARKILTLTFFIRADGDISE